MRALDVINRQRTLWDHHIRRLPVLVMAPHSRCNCRCVMCDIWRANKNRQELSADDLRPHIESLRRLKVQYVALTGGEALMHSNLWLLTSLLSGVVEKISLLSTGLLLRRHAAQIVQHVDEVIVSLDGPPPVHDEIRSVPRAFEQLADGVKALREQRADFPVTARSVVQRRNYGLLQETLATAQSLGVDGISFLAADVDSEAFNREGGWENGRKEDVGLDSEQSLELASLVDQFVVHNDSLLASGFVQETAEQLRRIAQHFLAQNGAAVAEAPRCNAPWVSAVVEPDGKVLPCFFHPPIGRISDGPLAEILNSATAKEFRSNLDVASDPICKRCTCALFLSPRAVAS